MARKKSTKFVALKWGRKTPFRRTIDLGTPEKPNAVTMVFEPGVKYEVSPAEVALLRREIACGMLVDPGKDVKGRYKDCREVGGEPEPAPEAEASEAAEE